MVAALFACAQLLPGTSSSFSATTQLSGNTLSAGADWTAPTITATTIQKTAGGIYTDKIKQGGTFYVYANVIDASGIGSVTASISNISTTSSVSLSSGSWTVNGVSYNYRSASTTATAVLLSNSYSYSVTAVDTSANTSSPYANTVVVDNTAFAGDSYSWDDSGSTVGKVEGGETLKFAYTKNIEPGTVVSGWTSGSQTVTVRITDVSSSTDTLTVYNSGNTSQLPLGSVTTNADLVPGGKTATFASSTMTFSSGIVSIVLGSVDAGSNVRTASSFTLPSWTPSATVTDGYGNASSTSATATFGANSWASGNKVAGTLGKPEAGDTLTYTFNKAPTASSIVSGWSGASATNVTVRIVNNGGTDTLAVYNSGNTATLPLGTINLDGDYVSADLTMSSSSMTLSSATLTITLGTPDVASNAKTQTGAKNPVWTPSTSVTDTAGAPMSWVTWTASPAAINF